MASCVCVNDKRTYDERKTKAEKQLQKQLSSYNSIVIII